MSNSEKSEFKSFELRLVDVMACFGKLFKRDTRSYNLSLVSLTNSDGNSHPSVSLILTHKLLKNFL